MKENGSAFDQGPLFPSTWPKFRGNMQQTGRSSAQPKVSNAKVWSFQTGKGIFSSPIVGPNDIIYVGSADRNFYALSDEGKLLWNKPTGEIIDSSGLASKDGHLYFGSGDGFLRCVDAVSGADCWTFAAEAPAKTGGLINWFEGNVAIGNDGTLYAPNDNFSLYAINPETGAQNWKFPLNDQSWSSPAVDPKTGDLYFGSNYIAPLALLQPFYKNIFSLTASGKLRWRQSVQASVAASPLFSREGLIVVGAFDGKLRAYNKLDGKIAWTFSSQGHLYASPSESADGTIIQPSTDGNVYGLDGKTGALKWSFATEGEPIRSSPAIDAEGHIYFGSGDGALYVLNGDGTLRFRMQLIDEDRNDLNASPALTLTSVILGSENGQVWSVPYDYCLRPDGQADERCSTAPNAAREGVVLGFVSPFGSVRSEAPTDLIATQTLSLAISGSSEGHPYKAAFDETKLTVSTVPETKVDVKIAGDSKTLTITPQTLWPEGGVNIHVELGYQSDKGNGTLTRDLHFGLKAKPTHSESNAFILRRLAVPVPTIMPSYNQIGFDSLSYVIRLVDVKGGKGTAWVMPALEQADGSVAVDPASKAPFPLTWDESQQSLFMSSRSGFTANATNLTIPFSFFRLSLLSWDGDSGVVGALASTVCKDIPTYGYFLKNLGFCSPKKGILTLAGAAELKASPLVTDVADSSLTFAASKTWLVYSTLTATIEASNNELVSLVIVDEATRLPIDAAYKNLKTTRSGDTTKVSLAYASGPISIRTYVLKNSEIAGSIVWTKQSDGHYELQK